MVKQMGCGFSTVGSKSALSHHPADSHTLIMHKSKNYRKRKVLTLIVHKSMHCRQRSADDEVMDELIYEHLLQSGSLNEEEVTRKSCADDDFTSCDELSEEQDGRSL